MIHKHNHNRQTLDMDRYAVLSGLAQVNPDFKVLLGLMSLVLCLMSEHGFSAALIGSAAAWLTIQRGGISGRDYGHLLSIPISFIVLSGIVLVTEISGAPMGYWDVQMQSIYLSVTPDNLQKGFLVSMKAMGSVCCLYGISLTTPLYEIIGVLKRWHVPEIMIELMYLIYRFIFILLETCHQMQVSAKARLGYVNLRRSFKSFLGICSNLLVIAFSKASKSFDAMESRCYDGSLVFLEMSKPINKKQWVSAGIWLVLWAAVVAAERIWL